MRKIELENTLKILEAAKASVQKRLEKDQKQLKEINETIEILKDHQSEQIKK